MHNSATAEHSQTLTVEVARTAAMLEALEPDYERLQRTAGNTSPFALFEWHTTWCSHFLNLDPQVEDELLIHVLRNRRSECVAIVPLVASRRRFGPLSVVSMELLGADPSTTEARSPLIEQGYEHAAARGVRGSLAQNPHWDWITWGAVDQRFGRALTSVTGQPCVPSAPGYLLDLPASWEELRAGLGRNLRESLRHSYNSLRRDGHSFRFEIGTTPDEVRDGIERFFELHSLRAQMPGTIQHPDHFTGNASRQFLLTACARLAAARAVCIFQLRIGGSVVAIRIGFVVGDCLTLYYSGFDPAWARYGVMTTALAESLKYAIGRRLKLVNLSRGTDRSKTRWRPRTICYASTQEVRPRFKSRVAYRCYNSARSGKGWPYWLLQRLGKARRVWT